MQEKEESNMGEKVASILGPDEIIFNDREGDFFNNMKGGNYLHQETEPDSEALTVATSAIQSNLDEASSSVPTVIYQKKVNDYVKRLKKERKIRRVLENKVKKLQTDGPNVQE